MHKKRLNRPTYGPGRMARVTNWKGFLFILILSVTMGLSSQVISADERPVDSGLVLADVQDNQSADPSTAQPSGHPEQAKAQGDQLPQVILFLGRFHMVVLHLPIGLIVTLFLLEFYILIRSAKQLMPVVWMVLSLACLSAIAAATFGTFLSWSGEYDPGLIFWHKWLGIGLAGLTVLAVILRMKSRPGGARKVILSYWVVLIGCGAVLVLASHNGASITHGSDFLTEHMPAWMWGSDDQNEKAEFVVLSEGDFGAKIYPILESRCFGCHGAEKQKSGLRVDSRDTLLAGGESGKPAIVADDALASEVVRRVLLPAEHEDAMPPKGKARLRAEQIVALIHWIDAGAPWGQLDNSVGSLIAAKDPEPSEEKPKEPQPDELAAGDNLLAKADTKPLVGPLTTPDKTDQKIEKAADKVVEISQTNNAVLADVQSGADAASGDSEQDFPAKIWPIIKATCVQCHGPEKQKSKLRLDSPDWIQKGADGEAIIVPGNPDESELYYRISLPAGDDDIMPAKGDPLTKEQIELIRQWIEKGASYEGWKPALATVGKTEEVQTPDKPETLLEQIAKAVSPASAEALAGLDDLVMPIAQDSPLLRVDFQFYEGEVSDELLTKLHGLGEQITWVNLKGSKITDSGLKHLAELPNLTRLHLENTEISDAGLVHLKDLKNLQYLNLYGTQVSDGGLKHLAGLKNLERLYLWQSEVTEDGAEELKKSLPKLEINLGWKPQAIVGNGYQFSLSDFFDQNSCCFNAHKEASCAHPCCKEATRQKRVCIKCNPGAEAKLLEAAVKATAALGELEKRSDYLSVFFDGGSCCFKAHQQGASCTHPCCITARVHTTVCLKCNAGAQKKLEALAILSGQPSTAEPKKKEAVEPKKKEAVEPKKKEAAEPKKNETADLSLLFDVGSCCFKAHQAGETCKHPCCVKAQGLGQVCLKCNLKAAAKIKADN